MKAAVLFAATAIVAATIVGAMLISGWRAGSLDNRIEPLFWAGAILGAVGIGMFGVGAVSERPERVIRWGMLLFLLAPVLCVVAVMVDYWI